MLTKPSTLVSNRASENGVILSEGDENGYISCRFFLKVVDVKLGELHGWKKHRLGIIILILQLFS